LCNTKNINYLCKHNIRNNIIYFTPIGYSEIIKQNIIKNKDENLDILFYGNIEDDFHHRTTIIEKIKQFSQTRNYNFVCRSDLYGDEKNTILQDTKIVIHIPSHENSHSFPWAKVTDLMNKKVFFIIEENEEMYIQGLDKLCVFYNRNDINDLQQKIDYYICNPDEKGIIVDKCYEYLKTKFNMDDLFIDNIFYSKNKFHKKTITSIKYKEDNNLKFYIEKQNLYLNIVSRLNTYHVNNIETNFFA